MIGDERDIVYCRTANEGDVVGIAKTNKRSGIHCIITGIITGDGTKIYPGAALDLIGIREYRQPEIIEFPSKEGKIVVLPRIIRWKERMRLGVPCEDVKRLVQIEDEGIKSLFLAAGNGFEYYSGLFPPKLFDYSK